MTHLLFDYDGTLHNSIKIYSPAFRTAYNYLEEKGLAPHKEYTDKEISYWLGFTADEMWNCFLPNLKQEEKKKCSSIIGNEMVSLTNNGKAELYLQTEEILEQLYNRGFHLILLSNCKHAYMQAHINYFQLDRFFSAFYCSEDFSFKPKYEIFNTINADWPGNYIIIGDRYLDIDIAVHHKLPSVGCLYGYGNITELQSATFHIDKLPDILQCL